MKHSHRHPAEHSSRILKIALGLTICIFLIEFCGGLWTHSLALMSDAWHVFIDAWALVASLIAIILAQRPASDRRTFGLHRMEVFAAFLNGVMVFAVALAIFYAAIGRWRHPKPVDSRSLLAFAAIGLILNLIVAKIFMPHSRGDINIRGAFLHILGDAMNTLAVIIAAGLMLWTGSQRIDTIVSCTIAFLILLAAGHLLREAFNTLLEGVPHGIDVALVEKGILRTEGVVSVHDLHVWSICSHFNSLSGHVLIADGSMPRQREILDKIGRMLRERFGISHSTIQVESKAWPPAEESPV